VGTLFGSTELAARIERAERAMLAAGVAAAARRRPEEPIFATAVAGGLAVWGGAGSPFCKVAGWGFGGVPGDAELAGVERAFALRGAAVRVELANLADPEIGAMLVRRGYVLTGFENVLGRPLPAPAAPPTDGIAIAPSPEAELSLWIDVVTTGFEHADEQGVASDEEFPREALERVFGDLAAAEGFRRYLARRDGEPAGGASLRIGDGVAHLVGAATLPAHRRRGVQSALLAARLADAAAAGCDLAVVQTQPGSKSQQNVQRAGFDLLYTRAVLVREA
jgi:GNAT superfamily N-acetyltransferase